MHRITQLGGVETIHGFEPHAIMKIGDYVITAPVAVEIRRFGQSLAAVARENAKGHRLYALPGGMLTTLVTS